jgi:hypothetical protein
MLFSPVVPMVQRLLALRGIGEVSAWIYTGRMPCNGLETDRSGCVGYRPSTSERSRQRPLRIVANLAQRERAAPEAT